MTMTREEAIKRIKYHKIVHKMNEPNAIKISEALDMAIEALTIDLVRCKECRFFKREECRYYIAYGIRRKPNDFCSYGKHKGGEE
jgi:hypothetical protein